MKKSILVLCLLICSFPVYSEEITVNQLQKKIEQLENRVAILENIIADQNNEKAINTNVITADRQIWRKLRKGMNQDDVRKLLGEPLTIRSQVFTQWFYSESNSHSYVMFDTKDKVNGWSEPE